MLIPFISVQCAYISHIEIDEVIPFIPLFSWFHLYFWKKLVFLMSLIASFENCAKSSLPYSIFLKIQILLSYAIFIVMGQACAFTPYVSLSFGYLTAPVAFSLASLFKILVRIKNQNPEMSKDHSYLKREN